MSGHRKILLNAYPAGAIGFDVQPLAGRRGCDTCSPDYSLAGNALARDDDAVGVDQIDALSEPDLDTQLLEPSPRSFGETLRKGRQNPRVPIDEHNSCGGRS